MDADGSPSDDSLRRQRNRDIDDETNSSLTESRHVSMQGNVPTLGSRRMFPVGEDGDADSFQQSNVSGFSPSASSPEKPV